MTIERAPAWFISHGAPDLPLRDLETARVIANLGKTKPAHAVFISAHWQTDALQIQWSEHYHAVRDFYGFPDPLQGGDYSPKGDLVTAETIISELAKEGLTISLEHRKGLDHAVWVPSILLWPDATVPISVIGVPREASPEDMLRLGKALKPLREKGIAIVASGGLVHNLGEIAFHGGPTADWARAFETWFVENVEEGRTPALLKAEQTAPHYKRAHPTNEHLLPVYTFLGSAKTPVVVHRHFQLGSIALTVFSDRDNC